MTTVERCLTKLLQKAVPEAQVKAVALRRYAVGSHYLEVQSQTPFFWIYFQTAYPRCGRVKGPLYWSWGDGPEFKSKEDLILWICRVLRVPDSVTKMLLLIA